MFGVSTHLYVADRLDRDHLVEIAAHGFDAVEVFALRSHFDYRDRRAAIALAEWLEDTRLVLASMHAPIAGRYVNGSWKDGLSLASADDGRRKAAVEEMLATLDVAAAVPYKALGTFGYMTTSRNNTVYIQYIPRTLSYVKANLAKYPRFGRLRGLLDPWL